MIDFINKLKRGLIRLRLYSRLFLLNRNVASQSSPDVDSPVIFFNASARLVGLNLNAAFGMIASWGIQLAGKQVYHFACNSGMSHCVLGAGLGDPVAPPPCKKCIRDTKWFTGAAKTAWFEYQENPDLRELLLEKSVPELQEINFQGRPLGRLVLPSIRWILRRHHLHDDEITRYLYSEFILSAHNIAKEFTNLLDKIHPSTVIVFNGLQYPEATARWVAKQQGIRVITHEVNIQPFSAFFTDGHATIYPLNIPNDFSLNKKQNQILNEYLAKRFRGDFTMAGIRFWSGMDKLPLDFVSYAESFEGIVPVFTNVIFDTSQAHANTLFEDMFAWLDFVIQVAKAHSDTLFVIRAHPDEMRIGKLSQESVASWAKSQNLDQYPNVLFVPPEERLSSYELIQKSKFTMVYNSSIGLEASLLGAPVLCAGKARYTQYPIVYFPESQKAYMEQLDQFLSLENISVPEHYTLNARMFLYFQLFKSSLPFDDFLFDDPTPGYVQLRPFSWKKLLPGRSIVIDTIINGILNESEFVLPKD
jgi:hypothetical protein